MLYENYNSGSATYKYAISRIIQYIPSLATGNKVNKNDFNKMKELNIHHIFPRGNKQYKDYEYINSIANLTPLEKDKNIEIGNESAKEYLNEMVDKNKTSLETMTKAYIDLKKVDNFDAFIEQRSKDLCKLINDSE